MINLRMSWWGNVKTSKELGITFDLAVNQTIGDQTWYFNCKNVPEKLPQGWSILEGELESFIGFGLSKQDVEKLKQNVANEGKIQSAVDFLIEKTQTVKSDEEWEDAKKEAKEMFERQIETSFNAGFEEPKGMYGFTRGNAIHYFNQTFKR